LHLIHIADTHLGLAAFNRLDPETGMNLREKQVYDNFLLAIDTIIQQKPDVLVHAGDLFDTVKPKTRTSTTVLEALDRLHAAGIPLGCTRFRTGKNEYIFYSIEYILYSFRKHIPILRWNCPLVSGCMSGYNPPQSPEHVGL
jgi:3',5'-cyclic AMP phosphodiesterase CpdA